MLAPPFDRTLELACRLATFRANWIEVQYCPGGPTLAEFLIRLRCQARGAWGAILVPTLGIEPRTY